MTMAASARSSMASRSAAMGIKGTAGLPHLPRRMRAWATVVRLAVSAATERKVARGWAARRTRSKERTRPFEAMVQPGRMRRPGFEARAAMGIRPRSAVPAARRAAHSEGSIQSI